MAEKILSINSTPEIENLKGAFAGIEFIEPCRTAKSKFFKPYPYVYDMLQLALRNSEPDELIVLLNSDISLANSAEVQLKSIYEDLQGGKYGLIFLSRRELGGPPKTYPAYLQGFDAFIFLSKSIKRIGESRLIFGLPWWDYWLPLEFSNKMSIGISVSSFIMHPYHQSVWDESSYRTLAKEMRVLDYINTENCSELIGFEALGKIYDRSKLYFPCQWIDHIELESFQILIDNTSLVNRLAILEKYVGLHEVRADEFYCYNSELSSHHPLELEITRYIKGRNITSMPTIVIFDAFHNDPGEHSQRWNRPLYSADKPDVDILLLCGVFIDFDRTKVQGKTPTRILHFPFPLVSFKDELYLGLDLLNAAVGESYLISKFNHIDKPKIYIWGSGQKLSKEIETLKYFFRIEGIFDEDKRRIGASMDSYIIQDPSFILCDSVDFVYIASNEFFEEIAEKVGLLFPNLKILNPSHKFK